MMAAVPFVHRNRSVDRHGAALRVHERAGEGRFGQGAKKRGPAAVERIEKVERHCNRSRLRFGQLRPSGFFVGFDRRCVLGRGELHADVRVQVAVGDVMDHLADRPAAGTVRRIELRIVERVGQRAEDGRCVGDALNHRRALP
jgi:hypothetical protein